MKLGIVSTFSDAGYSVYGKYFVESLKNFLDPTVDVFLYVDTLFPLSDNSNIKLKMLEDSCPNLKNFKERNKDKKFKNFLDDAVRFSHKSYAIHHAGTTSNCDILIWLDADTELIGKVSSPYLQSFLPNKFFTSYLGRPGRYTETGFLTFNLRNNFSKEFFDRYINWYNDDSIYNLTNFTDCHVYDETRIQMEAEGKIKAFNLTPGLGKNNFNNTFAKHMVHFKGDRKNKRN